MDLQLSSVSLVVEPVQWLHTHQWSFGSLVGLRHVISDNSSSLGRWGRDGSLILAHYVFSPPLATDLGLLHFLLDCFQFLSGPQIWFLFDCLTDWGRKAALSFAKNYFSLKSEAKRSGHRPFCLPQLRFVLNLLSKWSWHGLLELAKGWTSLNF